MRYKLFGRSGLRVSEVAFGAMTFGEDWGWGAAKEESLRMLERFAAAGGNFIDTANHYTNGTSERIVGEFVGRDRAYWVLGTKFTLNARPMDPNAGGNHRKNMVQSVEASLRRLGTEYIDVYWVHAWDPLTPLEEMMRGLDDLVRAGKVLYVGISDTPAWTIAKANTLAELRGWTRFTGLQIKYSLLERTPERDLLPMAKAEDLAVTVWGTLGAGLLSGKFAGGKLEPGTRLGDTKLGPASMTPRNLAIADAVVEVARAAGCSPSQVALSWARSRRGAPIIPILGARTLAQLEENLASLELRLPDEALRRLDEVSAVELGFPHEFLKQVETVIYGKTRPLIDDHRG